MNNMKTYIKILLLLLPFASLSASTQDTIYVMRDGAVLFKKAITEIDSISFENYLLNRKSIVEKIESDNNYSIFYQGLLATGLADSLRADRDKTYDFENFKYLASIKKTDGQWFYQEVPQLKKFGFTLLMESDSVFNSYGVSNLTTLKAYAASIYNQAYPEDANISDVKNRKNSLNRFIAYHIISKKLKLNMFIDAFDTNHMLKNRDMYEYIETMCPNSLIEIKKERLSAETNLINKIPQTGSVIRIIKNFDDKDLYNAYYYGIDKTLTFDVNFQEQLAGKRLRFDFASFFPELTNNNFRGSRFAQNTISTLYIEQSLQLIIPQGYVSRINASEQTNVIYLPGYHKFQNYEGDELSLSANMGKNYNFSIGTPPIPAGTYEIRYGYIANGKRGVAQICIDSIPAGIPVNLNKNGIDLEIGWEMPGSVASDPMGYENDKSLRNHGYMKGPACYKVITQGWTTGENARYSNVNLRKIIGTFTFNKAGNHTITVYGLSAGEFMLDFIEFVPVSALESEDIY